MTTRVYAPPDPALFAALVTHVRGTPDRKGEVWAACPNCGKGGRHFSFNGEKGAGFCFVCGYAPSLSALADKLGLRDQRPYSAPPPRLPRARRVPPWQRQAESLAATFADAPNVVERWRAYKPLPVETIRAYGFGLGVFPGLIFQRGGQWVRCEHERLIVPLRAGGIVTGFRCRAISCDCPKWLSPSGTKLTLFNGARLTGTTSGQHACLIGDAPGTRPSQSGVLFIVENIADSLLVEAVAGYAAVATHGVTIWRDEWTQACAAAGLEMIVVAYDHDLPGGGPANPRERRAMLADWARRHPRGQPPTPGGVRLANRLLAAGLQATRFPWPEAAPLGCDIGNLLIQETSYA